MCAWWNAAGSGGVSECECECECGFVCAGVSFSDETIYMFIFMFDMYI